jgi:hypothetical protein
MGMERWSFDFAQGKRVARESNISRTHICRNDRTVARDSWRVPVKSIFLAYA